MQNYLDLLKKVLDEGDDREDRTGVGTRALFGQQLRFDLSKGFPLVTTKKMFTKGIFGELLWFISGSGDNRELNKMGVHIWDANADASYWKPKAKFGGDLGRVYGVQWRSWQNPQGKVIDQLTDVIERLKKDPYDRRLIVSAWNPGELDQMALPPCHIMFQFFVSKGRLSLQMYQRSCDLFLGIPFNIASYSLLLSMVAQVTGLKPGEFIHVMGDTHIYKNHFSQVKEQISRKPHPLPELILNPDVKSIYDFKLEGIEIKGYKSHPAIKAEMAV